MNQTNNVPINADSLDEIIAQNKTLMQPQSIPARKNFIPKREDAILSFVLIILGYQYIIWFTDFTLASQWRIVFISLTYIGTLFYYARKKDFVLNKETYFWILTFIILSFGFLFSELGSLYLAHFFLHTAIAIYLAAIMFSGLLDKHTSNFLIVDIFNMLFVIPLNNIFSMPKSALENLHYFKKRKENVTTQKRTIGNVFLGFVLAIPLLIFIVPQLINADSSNLFTTYVGNIFMNFSRIFEQIISIEISTFIFRFFLSLPLSFFIGNLILGNANKRYNDIFSITSIQNKLLRIRKLTNTTITTIIIIVSAFYLLYIVTQIPYLFSALLEGKLPGVETSYSNYARDGFFELTRLMTLNVLILIGANSFSEIHRHKNKLLKMLNILLSIITLLLIVTAISKMSLYISTYGLTTLRILVTTFLIYMITLWSGIIYLQFNKFNITQFALITGVILLGIISIANIDYWIHTFNSFHHF